MDPLIPQVVGGDLWESGTGIKTRLEYRQDPETGVVFAVAKDDPPRTRSHFSSGAELNNAGSVETAIEKIRDQLRKSRWRII